VPQFQQGLLPYYAVRDGGTFVTDDEGNLVQQFTRESPITVTIPKGPMPTEGWPLLFYIHGTGGTAAQVYERGRDPGTGEKEVGGGPSLIAAGRGWAAAGMGGHLSGEHVDPDATLDGSVVFNLFNPRAMRDNYTQMYLERILFRRLLDNLTIDASLCPEADASAAPDGKHRFDPDLQVVMGQSLGSIVGGVVAAVDPKPFQGMIVSGAGATWIESAFGPTDPLPPELVIELLALQLPPWERLDRAHPALMLAELVIGPADNVHFLQRVLRDPTPGRPAPHALVFQGFKDITVTENGQRPMVAALGVDQVGPPVAPTPDLQLLPRILLAGGQQLDYPASGNFEVPGQGLRTAVLDVYAEDGILSGHHVTFQLDAPKHQYGCFLEDIAAGRAPVIVEGSEIGGPCAP